MRISKKRFIYLISIIVLIFLFYRFFAFNYISGENPTSVSDETGYLATFRYKPMRPLVSGIMPYFDRTFYIKNSEQKNVELTAILKKASGEEEIVRREIYNIEDLPFQGFKKIIFKTPLQNNNLDEIIFRFYLIGSLDKNESIKIMKGNTDFSPKYEMPRILYQDSIKGLLSESKEKIFKDRAFGKLIKFTIYLLLLALIALYIFESREPESHGS